MLRCYNSNDLNGISGMCENTDILKISGTNFKGTVKLMLKKSISAAAALCMACSSFICAFADHNTIGSYHWGANPENHYNFENWLGREQQYVLDFEGKETWYSIAEPYWLTSVWKNTKYKDKIILSVPMLPDSPSDTSLAAGANGDYDKYFVQLAQHLVNADMPNTIIRPGWEMNGNWYKWSACNSNEESFAKYFSNIVTAMRSVPGQNFTFLWNPAIGAVGADTEKCYPGDSYVDYVGLDVYDESWAGDTYPIPAGASEAETLRRRQNAWDNTLTRKWGLNWLSSFAEEHNKQIIIGEWGANIRDDGHSGGDNAYFIQWMHDWLEYMDDSVFAHVYFDVTAPDGDHALSETGTHFPDAAEKFRTLWGPGGSDMPVIDPDENAVLYGISINNISADSKSGEITVSGILSDAQPGAYLTVKILDKGKSLSSVSAGDIINIGDAVSDSGGSFTYRFKMPPGSGATDASQKYVIVIDGDSYKTQTAYLNYADEAAINAALNDMKASSSAAELLSKLEQYKDTVINLPLYSDRSVMTDTAKAETAQLLFGGKQTAFGSYEAFEAALKSAAVISALRSASDIAVFKDIVSGYNDVIGLELDNGIFVNIDIIKDKESVYGMLFNARNTFTDYSQIGKIFLQDVFSEAINQGGKSNVETVITAFNGFMTECDSSIAAVYSKYKSANAVNKAYVASEMYKITPASYNDLTDKFKSAVNSLSSSGSNTSSGGGGGGGGGGASAPETVIYDKDTVRVGNAVMKDIGEAEWARESIENLAQRGILCGYGDEFRPNNSITRGEFVKVVVTAFDLLDENASADFADIRGHWAYPYIASAHNAGIVNGIGDNLFGADEYISRQDMAAMIARLAESIGKTLPTVNEAAEFSDEAMISDYAAEAVDMVRKAGIINGYEDNTFRPAQNATRAETAKIIYSLINIL